MNNYTNHDDYITSNKTSYYQYHIFIIVIIILAIILFLIIIFAIISRYREDIISRNIKKNIDTNINVIA